MKKTVSIIFSLFLYLGCYATHNRAGEITYTYVNGYTYEITITTYTKESSTLSDKCTLTVNFGDSQSAVFKRVNGPISLGFCGDSIPVGEKIGNDIKKNIYRGMHTYVGSGIYVITMEDPNRNSKVCNFGGVASDQLSFFLRAVLQINAFLPANNSVVLSNPPIEQGCVGECFKHDLGASDADGDSLSFKLVPCYGNGAPISTYEFPDKIKIDSLKGIVEWCSATVICQYNIAILIEEWRQVLGTRYFMGSVIRDMQIDVLSSCPTSISKLNKDEMFTIVPNPSNGTFVLLSSVNQNLKANVSIINTLGQSVYETKMTPNLEWRIAAYLQEGIYFVRLTTEEYTSVQRLVIKN